MWRRRVAPTAQVLRGAEWSDGGRVEWCDRIVRLNAATSRYGQHQENQESSDEAKSRNSGL